MRPRRRVRPLRRSSPRRKLSLLAVCLAAGALSVLLQGSRPALAPIGDGFAPLPILRDLFVPQAQSPGTADALLAEAGHQRTNGAYEEAATLYRQALQQQPSSQTAILAGEASLAAGDYQGAVEMATTALRNDPNASDAHLIEAEAF